METAKAQLAQTEAQVQLAQQQLDRTAQLLKNDYATKETYDERVSQLAIATASRDAALAAVNQAQLNLDYTRVTAPVAGRMGRHEVSIGNLVMGGTAAISSTTLLTTIVSLDPIWLSFNVSEGDGMTYKRLVQKGEIKSARDNTIEVQGQLMDEKDWTLKGTINFVDNQYDRSSGTIRVRASFPNPNLFITPGQFGRVRVPMSQLHPTMLVPDAAVVTDQSVKMLFTVDADGTVMPKPVDLGPVTDDGLRIIRSGITPDDEVIISGLLRARPGGKVTPEEGKIEAQDLNSARRQSMNISHFFIDRPIFAAVISIIITIIGAVAYLSLPVAQYPEIAPPSISVSASYPGASAEIVAKTVATPLEQEINGVDDMLYMTSQSTSDGSMSLTVTFKLGTNLDTAQVLVQNRVSTALPRLPDEVRSIGVTVTKQSPDLMMVIHLSSPDGSRDLLYISNYATLHVKDVLSRVDGVGNVTIFGARDYSMRIWLDPEKLAARNLTAGDVVAALRGQNVQVAAGVIDQPPVPQPGAFQLNVETQGRLTDARAIRQHHCQVRRPTGRVTRIRDVARVELGAADYNRSGYLDERVAIPMGIFQRPGSNALATAALVQKAMADLSKSFPTGLHYDIVYNPTVFISQSVEAVIQTMFEAVILVVVVIIVFLQTWRASIIPIVAIPVSLIGTFAVLAALGFSLNNLSLFGLVLAIGIVVDDAIVVVENVERNIREGLSPREAAYKTMEEVGGALIAIALVLSAVFIPSAFLTGITGQFFRQFAVTIATATAISLLVSLTLSPALCALLFKPHEADAGEAKHFRPTDQGVLQRLQPRLRVGLVPLRCADRASWCASRSSCWSSMPA